MSYELIKRDSNLVHLWAGGSTAEIFLYPREVDYSKKNFEVRVSAAHTRIDNAKFSDFTGFKRFISPTKNIMHIKHEGHYEKILKPFEIDIFDGAWNTSSDGNYHDFNLLVGDGWDGMIKPIGNDEKVDFPKKTKGFAGIFSCVATRVRLDDETVELESADLLLFTLPISYRDITIEASCLDKGIKLGFFFLAYRDV